MSDARTHAAIQHLETLSRHDPGGRGLAERVSAGRLLPAAESLSASRRVLIVSGFCIRAALIGETDGPPGALSLADALRQVGTHVHLLSDRYSAGLLEAGMAASDRAHPLTLLPDDPAAAEALIDELAAAFAPSHVIAIERPGGAADGHRYSMRGEILDDVAPATDRLLAPPWPRHYTTLAIGDGGNEVGLGSLRAELSAHVLHGEKIFCTTAADHVIAAGISNWGGYALAAALSLLHGRLLIRTPEQERALLAAMVEAGAVDGCTRERALSVDGLGWEAYARTLDDMYKHTVTALTPA